MSGIVVTFALAAHLCCVYLAGAGPLLAAWNLGRSSGGSDRRVIARGLIGMSLLGLFAGAILGVGLGWWLASGHGHDYSLATARLGGKLGWGAWELVTFAACLFAALLTSWVERQTTPLKWGQIALLVLAGTNLMYHFPSMFIVLSDIVTNPSSREPISASQFRALSFHGPVLAKSLHAWGAALAVSGVWCLARTESTRANLLSRTCRSAVARSSARWALLAVVCQFLTGLWLVTELPAQQQNAILGGDLIATASVLVSLLAGIWLLNELGIVSLEDVPSSPGIRRAWRLLLLIVVCMSATVHRLNHLT